MYRKRSRKSDYTDDYGLRLRHQELHRLSYDDEILYLFLNPNVADVWTTRNFDTSHPEYSPIKLEYGTTGAVVIGRKDRDLFRKVLLGTYEECQYVKTTLARFAALRRQFVFNIHGQIRVFPLGIFIL